MARNFLSVDGSVIITFDSGIMATNRMIVEKIQEQPPQNPKRHKHADLIHAWAEGSEIQIFRNAMFSNWHDIDTPSWGDEEEYRIKPKTKTVKFRNYLDIHGQICTSLEDLSNQKYFKQWLGDWQEVTIDD